MIKRQMVLLSTDVLTKCHEHVEDGAARAARESRLAERAVGRAAERASRAQRRAAPALARVGRRQVGLGY